MVLSSEKNLYAILEIPPNSSIATIKAAYRKLARRYHPDLNGGNSACQKKFKEILEAYEILSDPEKKKNYDLLRGFYKEASHSKYSEAKRAYREEKKERETSRENNDVFSSVLNDILEGFKKTTSSGKNQDFKTKQLRPERGKDINTEVAITILEAIEGTTRTVNILHTQACTRCNGRTFINGAKCPICGGTGEQATHKKINVKIPPGVKNGSKIRIPNEGNQGFNGGKNGDLYLKVKIENKDSKFKYEGLNVLSTVPITPFEAALGASIEVETPTGKVSMKVTPNTQSGQKFRLAGQGLVEDNKKGDMIVTVNIEIGNLTNEEKELYEKLRDINKNNIRESK